MRIYQICFSPTGGTRTAAEIVCRALGGQIERINLMQHVGPLFFSEEDVCLIAVPVYGGRVPEAALRGLRVMKGNGIPTVLMAVYGNRAADDALLELRDEVYACGFHVVAAIEAVAAHSLFPEYGAGRPDEQDAAELAAFAGHIVQKLEGETLGEPARLPGHRPFRAYNGVPLKPKAGSRCTECGTCARECPVQAIPRDEPKRVEKAKCISCMHCVSVCPQRARRVNGLLLRIGRRGLAEACRERKRNMLYL